MNIQMLFLVIDFPIFISIDILAQVFIVTFFYGNYDRNCSESSMLRDQKGNWVNIVPEESKKKF